MKKTSAVLLAVVLLLSFCVPNTQAAATPSLSISSGKAVAGGNVTLTVSIQDNPGISSALLYFYYDTAVFTVDPKQGITADGTFRSGGGVIGNTIAQAKQTGRYSGDEGKDGALALWYNGMGVNTSGNGSFLKVKFQVNAQATNGNHTIGLGYASNNTLNQNGDKVAMKTNTATITVTGGVDAHPNPPVTGGDNETPNPPVTGGGNETPNPPVTGGDNETSNPPSTGETNETPASSNTSGTQQSPNTPNSSPKPDNSGNTQPSANGSGGSNGGGTNSVSGGGTKPEETAEPSNPAEIVEIRFNDVANHWAETYIQLAAQQGLVEGYNGLYRPNDSMRRCELVTILWRAKGSPKPSKAASFTDLTQDWYIEAVSWAEENGVFNGVGKGLFDPNGNVTREQLAAVLHRLAGSPMSQEAAFFDSYDQAFTDSAKVSNWARNSLYWTVYHEIYCGEDSISPGHSLAPAAAANRAQIAVMMVRYLQNYS